MIGLTKFHPPLDLDPQTLEKTKREGTILWLLNDYGHKEGGIERKERDHYLRRKGRGGIRRRETND